jgi:thiamine transporter
MIGVRHGLKWGLLGGVVYACLQMIQQFWPPPTGTAQGYIAVVMLDYIVAFGVLGLSGLFRGKKFGLLYAAPLCLSLRFLSHFISGIVVWGVFAEDVPVWFYSLTYNGSYMFPEIVLTTVVSAVLCLTAPPILFNMPSAKKVSEATD